MIFTNRDISIGGVFIRERLKQSEYALEHWKMEINQTERGILECGEGLNRLKVMRDQQNKQIAELSVRLYVLENPNCFLTNKTVACNGHGECDSNYCECLEGWVGNDCEEFLLWEEIGDSLLRKSHSAVVYQDKMWIFGGIGSEGHSNEIWKYDMGWNNVSALNPPERRDTHSAVVYQDKMWVFGGWQYTVEQRTNDLWMFSFENTRWEKIAIDPLKNLRNRHSAVVYQDKMWVFGGWSGFNVWNDLWSFDFMDGPWNNFTSSESPSRFGHSAVVYQDKMWIFGGASSSNDISWNDLWSLEFSEFTWTNMFDVVPDMVETAPPKRRSHSAVVYQDKMWVFGGNDMEKLSMQDFWSFDFIDYSWKEVQNMNHRPSPRFGHTSVVYNASIWIFGGRNDESLADLWRLRFS